MSPHGIHLIDGHIPSRGSAFGGPALLDWSRPHGRPTLLASVRPRTSIIMLLHGRHRRWVASAALHQNCEYRLRQAYWSRPVPPTHRNRRAFPHGKACSGCAASLRPPLCTAVRPGSPSGAVQAAGAAPEGRREASPAGGLPLPGCRTSPGPPGMAEAANRLVIQRFARKCSKVKVCIHIAFATSHTQFATDSSLFCTPRP